MVLSKCLFSSAPAQALCRTFVHGAVRAPGAGPWQPQRIFLPSLNLSLQSRRTIVWKKKNKLQQQLPPSQARRLPTDDEIPSRFVVIRDNESRLSEPLEKERVLGSLNPEHESLVMIARGGSSGSGPKYPICVVVNRTEQAKEKADREEQLKTARRLAVRTKEMELNWAIAPNDLEVRMRQLRSFLEKGMRVNLLLLSKVRMKKRRATNEEAEEMLRRVKEVIASVPGCTEYKPMEGKVGARMRLFFDGPSEKTGKSPANSGEQPREVEKAIPEAT